jgi:hypothetical protein
MSLSNKYNSLPTPIQYAILGGGLFLAYKLYKKITSNETTQEDTQNLLKKELDFEQAKLKIQKLTYPLSNYLLFANLLDESMRYGIGDNYKAVVNTLQKMNNNKDVLQLIKAYGNRQGYVFGIPSGNPKDLFTTIKAELGNEYAGLTSYKVDQINNDWKKKKISYSI